MVAGAAGNAVQEIERINFASKKEIKEKGANDSSAS